MKLISRPMCLDRFCNFCKKELYSLNSKFLFKVSIILSLKLNHQRADYCGWDHAVVHIVRAFPLRTFENICRLISTFVKAIFKFCMCNWIKRILLVQVCCHYHATMYEAEASVAIFFTASIGSWRWCNACGAERMRLQLMSNDGWMWCWIWKCSFHLSFIFSHRQLGGGCAVLLFSVCGLEREFIWFYMKIAFSLPPLNIKIFYKHRDEIENHHVQCICLVKLFGLTIKVIEIPRVSLKTLKYLFWISILVTQRPQLQALVCYVFSQRDLTQIAFLPETHSFAIQIIHF